MNESRGQSRLEGWALGAAIVIVAAWLALLGALAFNTGATEVTWARLFSVLGSLEAVAFAAAGALFGTTIQRQRVHDAHDRATKAEGRATEAERMAASKSQAAANGGALAAAVKTKLRTASAGGPERMSATGASSGDDLLALAESLFPD